MNDIDKDNSVEREEVIEGWKELKKNLEETKKALESTIEDAKKLEEINIDSNDIVETVKLFKDFYENLSDEEKESLAAQIDNQLDNK